MTFDIAGQRQLGQGRKVPTSRKFRGGGKGKWSCVTSAWRGGGAGMTAV